MIFQVEGSEIEELLEEIIPEPEKLPPAVRSELENKFGKDRNTGDLLKGFQIVFEINKIKGGNLHTPLCPACFYSTTSEINVSPPIFTERWGSYNLHFKRKWTQVYKELSHRLTPDAFFGSVIGYNTLRRKDEARILSTTVKIQQ